MLDESCELCKKEALTVIRRVQENAKRRRAAFCRDDGQWCAVSGQADEGPKQLPP